MNVSLTPELERFVQERVQSGEYASSSELVRDALRLVQERELQRQERIAKLENLRALIEEGHNDFESGRVFRYDSRQEAVADIRELALSKQI
jgi:antitoxin ParD1/3/4